MAKKTRQTSVYNTESFIYKNNIYTYPNKQWFLEQENEVIGINLKSIMGDSQLKIKAYEYSGIQTIKSAIDDAIDLKNVHIAAVVKFIEIKTSQYGNSFYWISLVDDKTFIKAYCGAKTFKAYSQHIINGRCSLFNISNSAGFVSFDKCISMQDIPFQLGHIFVVHIPFNKRTDVIKNYIEDNIGVTIAKGNVEVYEKTRATGLFIEPTISLINIIREKFGITCTLELYEDYIWGNSNAMIKVMNEYDDI